MDSDAVQKNEYPEKLNPFAENARLKEKTNNEDRNSWNPRKLFFSRHKRTPSSTTTLQLTKENVVVAEPVVEVEDEKEQLSRSVHRKMSRDTTPVESKCRTSNSTLRRKKRPAPAPPVNVESSLSSSSFTALSITDLSCRDTVEVETVLTITTITATTNERNERNEVDQLPLLNCHPNEEESEE